MSKMKSLTLGTLLAVSTILVVDVSVAHAQELKTGGIGLLQAPQKGAVEQRATSAIIGERTTVDTVGNSLAWSKGNSTIWSKNKGK